MIITSESRGLRGERPLSAGCSDLPAMADEMRPRGRILYKIVRGFHFSNFPAQRFAGAFPLVLRHPRRRGETWSFDNWLNQLEIGDGSC